MEAALTRTKPEPEKVIENIDMTIYEIPDPPKIEVGYPQLNILSTDVEDILKDNYVNGKVLEDKTIEQIKDEYNFDDLKDAFDDGQVTPSLIFFGGENEIFVNACNFLSPNEDNNEFISFLCSDMGQNMMTNNSLSIHVESGGIFYNDFNTKENFYDFLLAQQDESKQITSKRISFHHRFEGYTREYLPSFLLEEIDKFDMLFNKNLKYLLYKFNDWIGL